MAIIIFEFTLLFNASGITIFLIKYFSKRNKTKYYCKTISTKQTNFTKWFQISNVQIQRRNIAQISFNVSISLCALLFRGRFHIIQIRTSLNFVLLLLLLSAILIFRVWRMRDAKALWIRKKKIIFLEEIEILILMAWRITNDFKKKNNTKVYLNIYRWY